MPGNRLWPSLLREFDHLAELVLCVLERPCLHHRNVTAEIWPVKPEFVSSTHASPGYPARAMRLLRQSLPFRTDRKPTCAIWHRLTAEFTLASLPLPRAGSPPGCGTDGCRTFPRCSRECR